MTQNLNITAEHFLERLQGLEDKIVDLADQAMVARLLVEELDRHTKIGADWGLPAGYLLQQTAENRDLADEYVKKVESLAKELRSAYFHTHDEIEAIVLAARKAPTRKPANDVGTASVLQ